MINKATNASLTKQQTRPNSDTSVYTRELPQHIESFYSPKGKTLFKSALEAETMENYFKLASCYTTQADPAYCGPTCLAMILNSLDIDPNKTWKGIWRWYTEEVLHCSSQEIMAGGMSLDEITQLARCNGLHTMTFRHNDQNPLALGKLERWDKIDQICSTCVSSSTEYCDNIENFGYGNSPDKPTKEINPSPQINSFDSTVGEVEKSATFLAHHNTCFMYEHGSNFDLFETALMAASKIEGFICLINYSRGVLGQSGTGHFCPAGGYNAEAKQVLLMDTARFKYPPHWVDSRLLYVGVQISQQELPRGRGFICLTRKWSAIDRATLPPGLVRQPRLPSIGLFAAYNEFIESRRLQPGLQSVLEFMHTDVSVRTLLFTYLFQINDWFGTSQEIGLELEEKGYLSLCFSFRNKIQKFLHELTDLYQIVENQVVDMLHSNGLETMPILELFKRMVPKHQHEFLSIVLISLPKSIFDVLIAQSGESELWQSLWEISWSDKVNIEIAIEMEILANAFNGVNHEEKEQ